MEVKGIKQGLIPYVGQLWNLLMFLVKGLIIVPDVHNLLDGSCDVLCLPTHK